MKNLLQPAIVNDVIFFFQGKKLVIALVYLPTQSFLPASLEVLAIKQ